MSMDPWDSSSENSSSDEEEAPPLHMATRKGSYDEALNLLEASGEYVHMADVRGNTALHIAAQRGHVQILQLLVASGASVNERNGAGLTPLHQALQYPDIVERLLQAGVDINSLDSRGNTPLNRVVCYRGKGYYTSALALLNAGAVVGTYNWRAQLFSYIHGKQTTMLRHLYDQTPLLREPANMVQALECAMEFESERGFLDLLNLSPDCLGMCDGDGRTALHYAAENGLVAYAETICYYRPDVVNHRDRWGCTPMWLAARRGEVGAAATLWNRGGWNQLGDNHRRNPLHAAAKFNRAEVIRKMASWGANVNPEAEEKLTPLHVASLEGSLDAAQALVAARANLHAQTTQGNTPLHYAIEAPETARFLLDSGAGIEVLGVRGNTPLLTTYAQDTTEAEETAALLLQRGANVYAVNEEGISVVGYALRRNDLAMVRMLVQLGGFDVTLRGENGLTTLELAKHYRCDVDIIRGLTQLQEAFGMPAVSGLLR